MTLTSERIAKELDEIMDREEDLTLAYAVFQFKDKTVHTVIEGVVSDIALAARLLEMQTNQIIINSLQKAEEDDNSPSDT